MPPFPSARAALVAPVVLLLGVPGGLSAQMDHEDWLERCRRDSWKRDRVTHCEVRETGLRPVQGALRVDPGLNGGVAIRGWERDSIAVFAKIQARARTEADARDIAQGVQIVAVGASVRARGPAAGDREGWWVSFEVYVPRRTDLELATENGPLAVRGVSGRMMLSALNGPLSLRDVGGDVQARVRNGPLFVELTGSRWDGRQLDAETVNGPVTLEVPEGYSAELETGTVNGPMTLAFPLSVTLQGRVARRVSATLGQGGPPVRVVTTNGPLTIRRP
jgi:hypothetical protein